MKQQWLNLKDVSQALESIPRKNVRTPRSNGGSNANASSGGSNANANSGGSNANANNSNNSTPMSMARMSMARKSNSFLGPKGNSKKRVVRKNNGPNTGPKRKKR